MVVSISVYPVISRLYAKWNENKAYRPTHQNRFGATVGSIYYW